MTKDRLKYGSLAVGFVLALGLVLASVVTVILWVADKAAVL